MKRLMIIISLLILVLCTACSPAINLPYGTVETVNGMDKDEHAALLEREAKELDSNPHALSDAFAGSYLDYDEGKMVICLVGVDDLPENSSDGIVTYRKVDFRMETLNIVRDKIIPQFIEGHPDIVMEYYTQDYLVRVGIRNAEGLDAELIRQFVNERLGISGDTCPVKIHEYEDVIFIEE